MITSLRMCSSYWIVEVVLSVRASTLGETTLNIVVASLRSYATPYEVRMLISFHQFPSYIRRPNVHVCHVCTYYTYKCMCVYITYIHACMYRTIHTHACMYIIYIHTYTCDIDYL